jgi:protein-L-isoaspartate(D-aspartate) O-methyltransferase
MTSTATESRDRRAAAELRMLLTARLQESGCLRSRPWISAFASVPREVFVPAFFRERENESGSDRISSHDPATRDEWLTSVYDDDALITQIDDESVPVSSSTAPGLMALMLEALGTGPGMKVLEIGTGTGYNAALLSHRLGSQNVTSMDIDPELISAARRRLRSAGFRPYLAARDGIAGYAELAPYDRIISTVAVPAIPPAWIRQARNGGKILANLYRELGGGALVLLTVTGNSALGKFLPCYGGFMPIREIRPQAPLPLMRAARKDDSAERETTVSGDILDDPSFAFFAALLIPAQRLGYAPQGQPAQSWLLGTDGSWAAQTQAPTGALTVRQHGPRLLWDELEQARADWASLGSPPRHEFALSVTAAGTHELRHDPTPGRAWTLTTGL